MTEGGKTESWWRTLPGVLTAVAGILTALTALVAAITQLPWFHQAERGSPDSSVSLEATSPQQAPPSSDSGGSVQATPHGETFPGTQRLRVGNELYQILRAHLEPISDNQLALTLSFRVTAGSAGTYFAPEFVRLIADGISLAPAQAPRRIVPNDASIEDSITFALPRSTRLATLRITDYFTQAPSSLPLDLKAIAASPSN